MKETSAFGDPLLNEDDSVSAFGDPLIADTQEAAPKPKNKGTISSFIKDVGSALGDIPVQTKATVEGAVLGNDPVAIAKSPTQQAARAADAEQANEPNNEYFLGLDSQGIKSGIRSIPFSFASLGAYLGASAPTRAAATAGGAAVGGPAGAVIGGVGGTIASHGAGMAASAKAGYNMDTAMVLNQLYEKSNQEFKTQFGRDMTPEEFGKFAGSKEIQDEIFKHGAAEAGFEAAGNLITSTAFGKFLKPVIGRFGKDVAKEAVEGAAKKATGWGFAKAAGTSLAGELATETPTQIAQSQAETAIGLSDQPAPSWTSGADWAEAFKEVAWPTIITSGVIGGGAKLVETGTNAYQNARMSRKIQEFAQQEGILPSLTTEQLTNLRANTANLAEARKRDTGLNNTLAAIDGELAYRAKPSGPISKSVETGLQSGAVAVEPTGPMTTATERQAAIDQQFGVTPAQKNDAEISRRMAEAQGELAPNATQPEQVEPEAGQAPSPETAAIAEAAHQAATSPVNDLPQPTEAQKEAGNYKKGRVKLHGLDISIENPKGSLRSGVDQDGKTWETQLAHHYGYIKRTEGADGDQVDVFIGDKPASQKVFVVDQINPKTGKFDEHKALMGFDTKDEALSAYQANYQQGWQGAKAIHEMTVDQFKGWVKNGDTTKPLSESIPKSSTTAPNLSIGTTPNAAEPITVKNGVVHIGEYPAANFETGEDITVPEGADNATIAQALRDGGALSSKQKIYGLSEAAQTVPPKAPEKGKFLYVPKERGKSVLDTKDPTQYGEGARRTFLYTIKKLGGINTNQAKDITGEDVVKANRMSGMMFRKDGNGIDILAQLLHERGYLSDEAYNDVDGGVQATRDLVRQALNFEPVFTTEQADHLAELEAEAATADEQIQTDEGRELADDITEALEDDFVPDLDATPNSTEAELMRSLGFTEDEINAELNQKAGTESATDGTTQAGAQAGTESRGGEAALEEGQEAEGLTAYTNQDILDREKQAETAKQREEAEAKKAEAKAQANRERDTFTLTGSDRAADANPGQADIFGQPAEQPEADNGITKAIENAKRRLREVRKEMADAGGGNPDSVHSPRVMQIISTLRAKENQIERELRELRGRVFDSIPPVQENPASTEREQPAKPEHAADNALTAMGFKHLAKDYTYAMKVDGAGNTEYLFNVREFGTPSKFRVTVSARDKTGSVTGSPSQELAVTDNIEAAAKAVQKKLDNIKPADKEPAQGNETTPALTEPEVKEEKETSEFKKGDRVQIKDYWGDGISGRHGEILEKREVTWTTSVLDLTGSGIRTTERGKERTVYYDIKTDGGVVMTGISPQYVEAEAEFVNAPADPVVDGTPMLPRLVYSGIADSKRRAKNYTDKSHAARKAEKKAEWNRMALTQASQAKKYQDVWDAWAEQNPTEAAEIAGPTTQPAAATDAPATQDTGAVLQAAGLRVTKTQTKNGNQVWEVGGNTKEHSDALKRLGGRWYGPKKVWSYYSGDPSEDIAKALAGKVQTPAPAELAENEVKLQGNPYTYRKSANGVWDWRVASAPATVSNALKADAPIIAELEAELAEKSPHLAEKPAPKTPGETFKETIKDNQRQKAEEDLGAMFDDVLAEELGTGQQDELDAEMRAYERKADDFSAKWDAMGYGERQTIAEKSDYRGMRAVVHRISGSKWSALSPGEQSSIQKAATAPRTAGEAGASAVKNAAAGLGDAIDGLGKLFGGPGKLSAGLTFDEQTYQQAKPLFVSAISHLQASGQDLKDMMRAIVRMVVEKFGNDAAANMKPYVVRFMEDVRDGIIDYSGIEQGAKNDAQPRAETGNGVTNRPNEPDSGSDRGPLGDGLAEGNQGAGSVRGVAAETTGAGGQGRGDTGGRAGGRGNVTPGRSRDTEPVRHQSGPVTGKTDFTITDADEIGAGGLKTKYRNNVAAIRLLKQLEADDGRATPEEQAILAKYVGWGGIKGAFDPNNKEWSREYAELKDLLTDEEYEAARRSILDAHYTSVPIVRAIWDAVARLGFERGRVLEPSVGAGNFIGLMPKAMRSGSSVFGVELDRVTSGIARQLYQTADIAGPIGFQDVDIPANEYDLAIGNPPFGSQQLYDKNHPEFQKFSIHNFFFAKSLHATRPGGVMGMVVSRYFMDSTDTAARAYIADRAKLIGAVRLPYTAFKGNANTEVVTDIIFLQKLKDGETADKSWVKTGTVTVNGNKRAVNQYFIDNPDNVLGTWSDGNTMYAAGQLNVEPLEGETIEAGLSRFVQTLPKNIFEEARRKTEELTEIDGLAPTTVKIGGYFVTKDGKLARRTQDSHKTDEHGNPLTRHTLMPEMPKTTEARIRGLIEVRDALRGLMRAELSETAGPGEIEGLRHALNKVYDGFQKKYGYINGQANRRAMQDDPDLPLLESLEPGYDPGMSILVAKKRNEAPRPAKAGKADIFTKRVLEPYHHITHVDTPKDALIASLNEYGDINLPYMARISGKEEETLTGELAGLIYRDPKSGAYVVAEDYLTGNVKAKLAQAKEAAQQDKAYQANVEALEKVQPADLSAGDISVRLGSTWVPSDVVAQFASELLNVQASATYVPSIGRWMFNAKGSGTAHVSTWGTARVPADDIIQHILDMKPVIVKDNVGTRDEPHWVVNEPETQAAKAKAEDVAQKFKDWIWLDEARRTRLEKLYNDTFNTNRNRQFDGGHMSLPGSNPVIKLRRHQKDAIWRMLQDRVAMLDHVVGAGKTYTMVGGAMEMRRMGIARKPMFTVPNHLVRQWRDEFYKLYPNANILATTEKDFEKANRKRLFARIATGDWDAVIVSHSSFKKVGMPPAQENAILSEMLNELTDAIEQIKSERGDRNVLRDMERIKENLKAKVQRLNDKGGKKDDVVTMDELGVDALLVDEAHLFKNLFYFSQMKGVTGLGNPSGSGRAFDLFVKTRYLQQHFGGRAPVVFATGTPVSNSLVEMFTMQRYLAYDDLKARNIHLLDAWARVFGDVQQIYEVHPSGNGYRMATRFAQFVNLPELMTLYRGFGDIITIDDLKAQAKAEGKRFPVPNKKGGKPQLVVAERSDQQTRFFGVPEFGRDESGNIRFKHTKLEVVADGAGFKVVRKGSGSVAGPFVTHEEAEAELRRIQHEPVLGYNENSILWKFENLKELTRNTEGRINALSITNEARKAGLDFRLIDPEAPDFKGSKTNLAVQNIADVYRQWDADKGTQLVFCDLSVPATARAKILKQAADQAAKEAQDTLDAAETEENTTADEAAPEEEEAKISVDQLLATQSKFSVYDDVKQKLIAKGIPENEIAFIHDYDTADKKQKLFQAVRDGRIRVLLGSTEKMGAGMNVQDRLVAVHHLDAPWRPSDLEQRNGRIERQGNKLYERDPDGFEIQEFRYATKQTYDTRMWQIIEHKARGVEQLRRADETARTIDDISGEAASAADMKAAASGNPLILEEIKLRNEVKSLEAQESGHMRGIYNLQGMIANLQNADARRDARVAELKEWMALRDKHPLIKDAFSVQVGGRTINQRSDITAPIFKVLGEALKDQSRDTLKSLGVYRGVHFSFARNSSMSFNAFVSPDGKEWTWLATYTTGEEYSPSGMLTRIDNMLAKLDADVQDANARAEKEKAELAAAREEVGKPFPRKEQLDSARRQHRDVVGKLQAQGGAIELSPEMQAELKIAKVQHELMMRNEGGMVESPAAAYSTKAPRFYSALARAIESAKFESAPAGQWKLWLAGNAAKLGVKKDEIQWTGINEWLDLQKGKTAKADVLSFLNQNGVRVEEVVLGEQPSVDDLVDEAKNDLENDGVHQLDDGTTIRKGKTGLMFHDTPRGSRDIYNLADFFRSFYGTKTAGNEGTKFASYQLPGGENYRELLLTLPEKQSNAVVRKQEVFRIFDGNGNILSNGLMPMRQSTRDNLANHPEWRVEYDTEDNPNDVRKDTANFRSSHFDQPNILAHVRFNERTDADGKRVLFLEEIQSDWGQKGKKEGFNNGRESENWSAKKNHAGTYDVFKDDELVEIAWASSEQQAIELVSQKGTGIPAAPFVTDTKAWVGLSLKRMIAYAAENGFDRVAWTTGEQQAERYDLSKQIDRIGYTKFPDGKYNLTAEKNGRDVFNERNIDLSRVEEVVGKDIAKKMEAGEGNVYDTYDGAPTAELTGLDLKVGGEGMKAFYDQIVPQVANDILKKLGGGKVAPIEVAGTRTVISISEMADGRFKVYQNPPGGGRSLVGEANTRESAEAMRAEFEAEDGGRTQPGFDITPAMKEHAAKGLPLFQPSKDYLAQPGSKDYIDPYANLETRPNTTEKQKQIGRDALADAERRIFGRNRAGMLEGATLLGSAISQDFRADGGTSLVGQTAKTAQDLATVAQVLRDPRFETFRVFYTNKAGKIIGERAYSSRMPGAVYLPADIHASINDDMRRLKADGYWMLHNHPSGAARESQSDLALTANIARMAKGMLGHVVIDHNEYNHIVVNEPGQAAVPHLIKAPELAAIDLHANPEKAHPVLGEAILAPAALASIGKRLQVKDGYAVLIGTSPDGAVSMLTEIPAAYLKGRSARFSSLKAVAAMKRLTRETGSYRLFAVVPGSLADHQPAVRSGFFTDVVDGDGRSASERGLVSGNGAIPITKIEQRGGKRYAKEGASPYSTSAFRKWFGQSRVKTPQGAPAVVYHGTKEDFAVFDKLKLGKNGDHHTTSGLGFFFAGANTANEFAGNGNVMPVYLKIENPYQMTVTEAGGIGSEDQARAMREDLQKQGYDGIRVSRGGIWVAFEPNQIKSAIGNNGNFDPENPSIVESPASEYFAKVRKEADTLIGKAAAGVKQPKDTLQKTQAFFEKIGPLSDLPDKRDYLIQRYLTLGKIAKMDEVARGIYDAFAKSDEPQAIYDYLTTQNGSAKLIKDDATRQKATEVKAQIMGIGQDLVDRGLLDEETYAANRGAYLPRVYLKHLLDEQAFAMLGTGRKPTNMGYLKHRKDIPEDVRRLILGEITDPAYLAARGFGTPARDIAILDWLAQIAKNKEWVLPASIVEWKGRQVTPYWLKAEAARIRTQARYYTDQDREQAQKVADSMDEAGDTALEEYGDAVPHGFKQMPNFPRYGLLRGMIVRSEIFDDIVGATRLNTGDASVAEQFLGDGGVATKFTQIWKWAKVAANPPAQIRNFVSNGVLLHLSGVPFHQIPTRIVQAIKEIRTDGKYWKIAKKYGVTESTFAAKELFRIEREMLDLKARQEHGWGRSHLLALAGKVMDYTGDIYQLSEAVFKTAKIMDAMKHGMSEGDAALEAQKWMFDYSMITPSMRYLRNAPVGAPFITFYMKALPRMLEVVRHHPLRLTPYLALPYILTYIIAGMTDTEPDDVDKLKKALPEWLQERGHAYFLPVKDDQGRWVAMDFGYFFPWVTWTELAKELGSGEFGASLMTTGLLGGPVPDMISAAKTGIDPFSRKPIVNEYDTPSKQIASLMNYLWRLSAPTWLTDYGFAGKMYDAVTDHVDKYGEPTSTEAQAALRLVGVNLYPIDPAVSRQSNIRRMQFEIQDQKRRMTSLLKNPNLSADDRRQIFTEYTGMMRDRQLKLREYAQESQVHPNLR